MLGNLTGGKFKVERKNNIDALDLLILKKINGGISGTIEISKEIKLAPKNLINRIKKYQRLNLIIIDKQKLSPAGSKGWKRFYKLSDQGRQYIEILERSENELKELNVMFKGSPVDDESSKSHKQTGDEASTNTT